MDSRHQWLLNYWTRARQANQTEVPSRSQIDLDEFGRLQRGVILFDLVGQDLEKPQTYRFRRIGHVFKNTAAGYQLGETLQSIQEEDERRSLLLLFSQVVQKRTPQLSGGSTSLGDEMYLYERVTLPLSDTGTHIDMILTSTVFRQIDHSIATDSSIGFNGDGTVFAAA